MTAITEHERAVIASTATASESRGGGRSAMTNTYTITTDDAFNAIAMITIFDCLQADDIVTGDVFDAFNMLIEMCIDNPINNLTPESARRHAAYFQKVAGTLLDYAASQDEAVKHRDPHP